MAWESLKAGIAQVIKTNGNQEITGLVLQQELFRVIDECLAQGVISTPDITKTIRKVLTPYGYASYLPDNVPYTTPTVVANTPTKIKIPTTIKSVTGFAVVDRGLGNMAVQYQGTEQIKTRIFVNTGVQAGTNNTDFNIYIYKNDVKEQGLGTTEKLQTGSDIDNMMIAGEVVINPLDFLEIWISTNLNSTFTFSRTSIMMVEA